MGDLVRAVVQHRRRGRGRHVVLVVAVAVQVVLEVVARVRHRLLQVVLGVLLQARDVLLLLGGEAAVGGGGGRPRDQVLEAEVAAGELEAAATPDPAALHAVVGQRRGVLTGHAAREERPQATQRRRAGFRARRAPAAPRVQLPALATRLTPAGREHCRRPGASRGRSQALAHNTAGPGLPR